MKYILLIFCLFSTSVFAQNYFVSTWKTDNSGLSNSTSIIIPIDTNKTYNYDVDWNNDGTFDEFGIIDSVLHDFGTIGTYTIAIRGIFPQIYFNDRGDKLKILDVSQWGDNSWTSMTRSFYGCENLNFSATDAPDLSLVTNLEATLKKCLSFNSNINHWDVSTITSLQSTFQHCGSFNLPLNNWNVSNVTTLRYAFSTAVLFNQPLNNWDVSNVINMSSVFHGATSFNQNIGNWTTTNLTSIGFIFSGATSFNQDINTWDVSNLTSFTGVFNQASAFNQPLNNWDISNATTFHKMFSQATSFNQPLNNWNVSNATTFDYMFNGATAFDQNIGGWNMSNAQSTIYMFRGARVFNQDIGNWNMSNVTDIEYMFESTQVFNQDIGNWDVSNVTNMRHVFHFATAFNQNLSNWNTQNVTNMNNMFRRAFGFNQNIGSFNMSSVLSLTGMLAYSGISQCNYDHILKAWSIQPLNTNLTIEVTQLKYCDASLERQNIITNFNWTFTGDANLCTPAVGLVANAGSDVKGNCKNVGQAIGSIALPYLNYQWTPATTLNDSLIAQPHANPNQTTSYFLSVTDTNGCTLMDTMQFIIPVLPAPTTPNDIQYFCASSFLIIDSIQINEPNVNWYDSLSGGNQLSLTNPVIDGHTYFASLYDTPLGCESNTRLGITIFIDSLPQKPTITNASSSICVDQSIQLSASPIGGIWNIIGLGSIDILQSIYTSPISNSNDTLIYSIQGSGTCSAHFASDTIYFNVVSPAPSTTMNDTQTLCLNLFPTIDNIQVGQFMINWYDSLLGGNRLNLVDTLLDNTSYFASFIDLSSGCESTTRTPIQIYLSSIEARFDTIFANKSNTEISFIDMSLSDITNWFWDFGDGTSESIQSPFHTYSSGNYEVLLTVENTHGCLDTTSMIINISDNFPERQETKLPNIFTPNGDGINDYFTLGDDFNDAKELHIFNRWGHLIYFSKFPNVGWDGRTYPSGDKVPESTYFYIIITKTGEKVKGQLTLLR